MGLSWSQPGGGWDVCDPVALPSPAISSATRCVEAIGIRPSPVDTWVAQLRSAKLSQIIQTLGGHSVPG